MEIKLTNEESEQYFLNALCNGLSTIQTYSLDLTYDKNDYKEAKEKLDNPCFEDVLMQILKDGKSLTLLDEEDEDNTKTITLKDVHERVQTTQFNHLSNMILEQDDAETADVILQTVFYKEIIFS